MISYHKTALPYVPQSKLEVLERGNSRKEADLRGHLENEKLKEKSNQTSPNKDSNEMESVEDYQLNRAIDLIRSISVYEGLRKAS